MVGKLEVGALRRVGRWTLVSVELTKLHGARVEGWSQVYASKEPYAVVVLGGDGMRFALDPEGRTIPLADLVAETPTLEPILKEVAGGGVPDG